MAIKLAAAHHMQGQPYPSKHNLESQSATELEVLRSSLAYKVMFVRHYKDYQVGYMGEGELGKSRDNACVLVGRPSFSATVQHSLIVYRKKHAYVCVNPGAPEYKAGVLTIVL